MKTLKNVAKKYAILPAGVAIAYRDAAQKLIKNGYVGWVKPPYLTGNLYRKIGSYNTAQRMIKESRDRFYISLNYAPPGKAPKGAYYGKYVEWGTWKMQERPFAKIAANTKEVKEAVAKYQRGVFLGVSSEINDRITTIFKKGKRK